MIIRQEATISSEEFYRAIAPLVALSGLHVGDLSCVTIFPDSIEFEIYDKDDQNRILLDEEGAPVLLVMTVKVSG